MNKIKEILSEIEKIKAKSTFTFQDAKSLSDLYGAFRALNLSPATESKEQKELIDIFPALETYKTEHNIINLQKLCVEMVEFCNAIYASTQNEEERSLYREMLEKINK